MSTKLYLGRQTEDQARVEIDPDIFTTHGVILGMTGSGKTGLALGLLEEMVQAGVPVIAIDPKGDLPNLALLFPEFSPSDFERWGDPAEAERSGITPSEMAARKAEMWKKGLAGTGIDPAQMASLKQKLDLRILTPGSKAVAPVNLMANFEPPDGELPEEDRAELASGIVSGLLSLVADNVDPLRDPRHLLLVQVLSHAWNAGNSLTLEDLISQLVDPPFAKVGIFPVDRFFSPDDRMSLALQLNSLLASPTFAAWKSGPALDIESLMKAEPGRTPVNVFYLAHLSEKERHFFVGRLMNEILSWSRGLSGSSSLRALIYFDEVAGYLPPHPHDPASKKPILTLLKQSRAVGVGLILATQNPVDLDYKALSNMGTWMIGRLQTRQDRDRVRDGLMSASGGLTAKELEEEFSKIQPRTFLLKKPKSDKPVLFHTRWAMSYLRGPLTLAELPDVPIGGAPLAEASRAGGGQASPVVSASEGRSTPPPIPSGFGQSFMDPRYVFHSRLEGFFEKYQEPVREDGTVLFRPGLRAVLRLQFDERKDDFVLSQVHQFVAFPLEDTNDPASLFRSVELDPDDCLSKPPEEGRFAELHESFDQLEELKSAEKELAEHVYRTLTATRYVNKDVKLYSAPEEEKDAFLERCREEAQQLEDKAAEKLQSKLESKTRRLEERMRKAQDKVERLQQSEKGKKMEQLWNAGEMLLSLFTKRRKSFSTVLSKSRMAAEATTRADHAEEEVKKLQADLLELQETLELELADLDAEYEAKAANITEKEIRLNKNDIQVERFEIFWVPVSKRV